MLSPKWSHDPLSGAGAARFGGRYNPPGMPALYMSEAFATAVAEYEQDLGIRPGTLCAYQVSVAPIVDLCNPAVLSEVGWTNDDLRCAWKKIALIDKAIPPGWVLAQRLVDAGFAGVRVPSVQTRNGINVVLWRWNDGATRVVTALDPLGDLPRSQASWA
jgi:RES domain-containing protein